MTNETKQTAVKLYTEEQVRQAFRNGFIYANLNEINENQFINSLVPIELPTDEEIKKMMELDGMEFDEFDPYDVSYLGGATWMRNKIQGGNK
jgi:hypothetical protein